MAEILIQGGNAEAAAQAMCAAMRDARDLRDRSAAVHPRRIAARHARSRGIGRDRIGDTTRHILRSEVG
jgi:hypothetical protein